MPAPEKTPDRSAPPALRSPAWESIPGLIHGFYGRAGGCSSGALAGLNLSDRVGDAPENVARNWQRLTRAQPGLQLIRMAQVHGDLVRLVEHAKASDPPSRVGECDGLLTRTAGIGLTVMTADCVPILLVAPDHRAVMALHAGWRGTLAGIAAVGIERAQRELAIDPGAWRAALGPAIDSCCYQVSREIGESFAKRWGAIPGAWTREGDKGRLDLRRINAHILVESGVPADAVDAVGPCTACDHERFFSHRRSGGNAGRQVSLIGFSDEIGVVSPPNHR